MDDVDFLLKNGVEETFIFLADSSKRDKSMYPSANEFEVVFNAQFRNVVKFEILEVNIARTDYIVDKYENTLTYSVVQPKTILNWNQEIAGNVRTATIAPGDYNLPQLIDEMNLSLRRAAANTDTTVLSVEPVTNPSEISNKIRLTGSGPFAIIGEQSTMGVTLGLGDPVSTANDNYDTVPGYTVNFPNGAGRVFLSKPGVVGETLPAFVGPVPAGDTSYEGVYGTRTVSQIFTAAVTGVPINVSAFLTNVGTPPPGGFVVNVAIIRVSDSTTIATGTVTTSVPANDYVPATGEVVATENFVVGDVYRIDFSAPTATVGACAALWYAVPNLPPVQGAYAAIDGQLVHQGSYFCVNAVAGTVGHELTPSGIVNLRGARYVKVRCKEIEQMISRDRVGEPTTAGVALVNMIGYGYQNSKTDFVRYPAKRFHPIGKLQKLTFSLERSDGNLYECNGVDNSFLCALTYVVSPRKPTDEGPASHPAAPKYSGDFLRIQQNRWSEEHEATKKFKKSTFTGCRPSY